MENQENRVQEYTMEQGVLRCVMPDLVQYYRCLLYTSTGLPNRRTSPSVGVASPHSIFMVVDLPEPLRPIKP